MWLSNQAGIVRVRRSGVPARHFHVPGRLRATRDPGLNLPPVDQDTADSFPSRTFVRGSELPFPPVFLLRLAATRSESLPSSHISKRGGPRSGCRLGIAARPAETFARASPTSRGREPSLGRWAFLNVDVLIYRF